jgi:hypothetical protein
MVMLESRWNDGATSSAGCVEHVGQFAVKAKLVRPTPKIVKVKLQTRVLDDADHIVKVSWSARS